MIQKNLFTVNYKQHKVEIMMHLGWYSAYTKVFNHFLKHSNINNYATSIVEVFHDNKWEKCKCFYVYEDDIQITDLNRNLDYLRSKIHSVDENIIFAKIGGAEFIF